MHGEVFIVWGGNKDLAEDVSLKLRERLYSTRVGGDEREAGGRRLYLGAEIQRELQKASRAIVLAQRGSPGDGRSEFRPNLMFEWGYLVAKLPPAYLHVFLIDIERSELPSDLQGSWCEVIHSEDSQEIASHIVSQFIANVRQDSALGLDVLIHWSYWREWLAGQASGHSAPDSIKSAGVLLHSIQPAFYSGELKTLKTLLPAIQAKPDTPPELQEAQRIVSAAVLYYLETDKKEPGRFDLNGVRQALEAELSLETGDDLALWADIIRLDFLGLALHKLAQPPSSDPDELLEDAEEYFQRAFDQMSRLTHAEKPLRNLWGGYILRNLGRVQHQLGTSGARKTLEKALEKRRRAFGTLQAYDLPDRLISELQLEVLLLEVDLALEPSDTRRRLSGIVDLLESEKAAGAHSVFRRLVANAAKVAGRIRDTELLKRLELLR